MKWGSGLPLWAKKSKLVHKKGPRLTGSQMLHVTSLLETGESLETSSYQGEAKSLV